MTDRNKEVRGAFYKMDLTSTSTRHASVEVFIPDHVKTAEQQKAFALAEADASEAWIEGPTETVVTSLVQENRAVIMDSSKQSEIVGKAYWGDKCNDVR